MTAADPGVIWRLINGFGAYWAAVTAVDLGVFESLHDGPMDGDRLAKSLRCDPRRLLPLCDALVAMGLMDRIDDQYGLTPESDAFLLGDRPGSMRDLLIQSPGPWSNWSALAETVRGAPPPQIVGEAFYAKLAKATFPTQHALASRVAPMLGPLGHFLELGAGAAPWTIAFLELFSDDRAVVNDLPAVLETARETAVARGLADRCDLLPGDYHTVPLPDGAFDAVILANVVRAEGHGDALRLLARAAQTVRPGGRIIVADYFVDEDRRGPLNALILGTTMVAATSAGATFTRTAFEGWLTAVGLVDVELVHPSVLIARKEARHG